DYYCYSTATSGNHGFF
nr:immunoglobulin light chain junction region [Macaca mulatta]MOX83055.1 immunoglobulin light chain junction region [Macaca mulatta]